MIRMHSTRWSAACLLLLGSVGCTGMVRLKTPASYIETAQPRLVRVTRPDGTRIEMIGARVWSDTLMGFVTHESGAIAEFREMPLAELTKVEAEARDPKRTAFMIGGAAAGFASAWYLFYLAAQHEGTSQFCRDGLYGAGIPCD